MSEYSLEDVSTKSVLLILEDGTQFHGRVIGVIGSAVGEAIFNTSMTGYQEILTDPSYSRQIIVLIYPYIGNVGTNDADEGSSQVHAQGPVIRDLPLTVSNFRNTEDLSSYLERHNIVAATDIDTCKLTCLLREEGVRDSCITAGNNPGVALTLEKARAFPGLNGMDLTKEVTTTEAHSWTQRGWTLIGGPSKTKKEDELPFYVVVRDFGAKHNILWILVDGGCRLTIVLTQTSVEDVPRTDPDGTFLSNDPDNPASCDYIITAIQKFLKTDILVFDICLGHQLLALTSDAKTVKMKFGHHDGNYSVRSIKKNVVMITAQSHGFAVDEATLPANLRVAHKSLFDGALQGIHRTDKPAPSFQGYSEVSPGPHDAVSLFDHFIELIKRYHKTAK